MPNPEAHPVDSSSTPLARREFCLGSLATGLALACVGCGGGASFAQEPPAAPSASVTTTDTKAALLATLDGTTRDYRNQGSFLLVKDATGIYAMTAICTHLGCTVGLPAGGHLLCPCHGSQYDLSGANLVGPAILPLVHFEVTEPSPGGFLVVNPARTVAATVRLT